MWVRRSIANSLYVDANCDPKLLAPSKKCEMKSEERMGCDWAQDGAANSSCWHQQ